MLRETYFERFTALSRGRSFPEGMLCPMILEQVVTDPDNSSHSRLFHREFGTISSGLLSGVRACDRNAWRRMSVLYGPLVYYWCRRQGLQSADADDVVQDVFKTVAQRVDAFRRG